MNYFTTPGLPYLHTKGYKQRVFAEIITTVCSEYEVNEEQLKDKTRKREIAMARQVAMYLLRSFTQFKLREIGDWFNGRDHTTVIHSCQTVRDVMDVDSEYRARIEMVRQRISDKF